jgi:DNA-binding NarL/FixJ family response regulator
MESGANIIKVGIVDRSMLFRAGLSRMLNAEDDIKVVMEAYLSDDLASLISGERPDVLLVDGGDSGVEAAQIIRDARQASPTTKIVILALHDRPRVVEMLLSAGASAYVLMSTTPEELITVIRTLHREVDRVILSVSQDTLNMLKEDNNTLLSPREREVISLVYSGMRNAEIAERLFIAEGTVKRHLTNIYAKLGAASRMDAVNKAVAIGLLFPGDPIVAYSASSPEGAPGVSGASGTQGRQGAQGPDGRKMNGHARAVGRGLFRAAPLRPARTIMAERPRHDPEASDRTSTMPRRPSPERHL